MTKARRLGMGMKPRDEAPTAEGQPEPVSDPIQEQILAAVEGGDLESVSAADEQTAAEAEPEEKIDASEELQATQVEEPPFSLAESLDDMLKASGGPTFTPQPIPGRQFMDGLTEAQAEELNRSVFEDGKAPVQNLDPADDPAVMDQLVEKMTPILAEGIAGESKHDEGINPRTFIKPPTGEEIRDSGGVEMVRLMSREEVERRYPAYVLDKDGSVRRLEPQMGELPSGEYRHTVRIAESYVEGAKQQAEADNMTLEDWLSLQLNTYLEQWWFAAGPKS